jgi:hypothetical protein
MNWTHALVYERLLARQTAAAEVRLAKQARATARPASNPAKPRRTVRGIWFPGRPITVG